ncbi:site-specific integrase [uncultured Neptuniibacter sp.]|uniref:tyrosine-type recombinase/integrase n=1 Tax=uncultured Neptuniibacter sp. TaxID=502143 RepID=UPI00261A0E2C|nr:site-specific integrase [uncultured Neptuniibacter sp.]
MNAKEISAVNCYLMGLAPSGRRSMRSQLTQVAQLLGKESIDEIEWYKLEYQQLIFIRSKLQETDKSVNTINTTMAAIRGVVRTAFKMELVTAEHLARICQLESVRGTAKKGGIALSLEESRKLVRKAAETEGPKGIRDTALLMLMITTGLRRSEVVALNHDSFDFERLRVSVRGEGGKLRYHDISGVTLKRLKQWAAERGDIEPLSPFFTKVLKKGVSDKRITVNSVYRLVKKQGESIGIKGLRPHDLRRTYISLLLEQGSDLSLVSKAAGHANVMTTTRYDKRHVNAQTEAMRTLTDNLGRGLRL